MLPKWYLNVDLEKIKPIVKRHSFLLAPYPCVGVGGWVGGAFLLSTNSCACAFSFIIVAGLYLNVREENRIKSNGTYKQA